VRLRRRNVLWFCLGGALLAGTALAIAAAKTYDILYERRLHDEQVLRVLLFGELEFYVSAEARDPALVDMLNGDLLLVASSICLVCIIFIRFAAVGLMRRAQLFLAGWLGTAYLALDEHFAVHESIGHNLGFLTSLPGIEHPDDFIVAAYAIPVGIFAFYFRREILAPRWSGVLFAVAFVVSGQAVLSDVLGLGAEEALELVSSAALVGAFLVQAARLIRDQLLLHNEAGSERASLKLTDKTKRAGVRG
jgi:hypothetical protein